MKRKIILPVIGILVVIVTVSVALAINLSSFKPAKDSRITNLWNTTYRFTAKGDVGAKTATGPNSKPTIKPYKEDWRYGIIPTAYRDQKTVVGKGSPLSKTALNKLAKALFNVNSYELNSITKNSLWFKASDKPVVATYGYKVWDTSARNFVKLAIRSELLSYSTVPKKDKVGTAFASNDPLISFTNASKQKFFGLPSIHLLNVGNALVRHTFYKINSDNSLSPYNIKTNITYFDLDGKQAVSIAASNSGGFSATDTVNAQKTLSFGQADNYYTVQSNYKDGYDADAKDWHKLAMNFYVQGSQAEFIYTSGQVNGKNTKANPTGKLSLFGTKTYNEDPSPVLETPIKRVYDKDSSNDISGGIHNKIRNRKESFWYEIEQKIPAGLEYSSEYKGNYRLDNFVMEDFIDDCLKFNPTTDMPYKVTMNGKNITEAFHIRRDANNNKKIVFEARQNAASSEMIYNKGNGGTLKFQIPVTFVKKEDEIGAHTANNMAHHKSETKKHKLTETATIMTVPNEAKITYKTPSLKKDKGLWTNPVWTSLPPIFKHDIVITKNTSGEVPDKSKRFTYQINLSNGDPYEGTIRRANGKTEKVTFRRNVTVQLAHCETFTIPKIPQDVTYTIKEKGTPQYSPSYSVDNTSASSGIVENGANSGSAGQGDDITATGTINKDVENYKPISYTFTNSRTVNHHKLEINKEVIGADTDKAFDFTVELAKLDVDENRTYTATLVRQGESPVTTNRAPSSAGKLNVNVSLKDGDKFYIAGLPDEATYRIREAGEAKTKASFKVTENPHKVVGKTGSDKYNKGVYTPTEQFKIDGTDYNITYNFENFHGFFSDISVGKKVTGSFPKNNNDYEYEVSFDNLPLQKGKYNSIGVEIYKWKGERKTVGSIAPKEISSSSYKQIITLKADEIAVFSNVPEGVTYSVTEKGNDYTAAYQYEATNFITNESEGKDSASNDRPYTDLSRTETLPEEKALNVIYTFTNDREAEPIYNKLRTEKIATDASNTEFDFTANLMGLAKNQQYALYTETGDTEYRIVKDGNALRVRSGLGTIGDPYTYIGGLALEITRNDGEKKMIYTSTNPADNNLEPIQQWIDYKGGNYTVKWIGGMFNPFGDTTLGEAYAVFDSEDNSLTFLRDTEGKYTNGQQTGSKIYYTGIEETGTSNPPWQANKEFIRKVSFLDAIKPTSTYGWFADMSELTKIEELNRLDTSETLTMKDMFRNCSSLAKADLTGFDTNEVSDMSGMFAGCTEIISLDMSSFATTSLTNTEEMFKDCLSLETIYASDLFTTGGIVNSDDMFTGVFSIEGEAGTRYKPTATDKTYAVIDEPENPGYFTFKEPPEKEVAEDEEYSDTYTGHIETFASDANGNATVNYTLSNDVTKSIDGLPKGSKHIITEAASLYDPMYKTKRNNVQIDYKEGEERNALSTRQQTFDTNKPAEDYVTYTNDKKSYMLKTRKTTSDETDKEFDFHATVKNLEKDEYTAMVPGEGNFEITMNPETGDIKLVAENYDKSIEGIPIKLIRPYDNAEKIVYTDANGEISADEFFKWLTKKQKGKFHFILEWNGGRINGSFVP